MQFSHSENLRVINRVWIECRKLIDFLFLYAALIKQYSQLSFPDDPFLETCFARKQNVELPRDFETKTLQKVNTTHQNHVPAPFIIHHLRVLHNPKRQVLLLHLLIRSRIVVCDILPWISQLSTRRLSPSSTRMEMVWSLCLFLFF